MGSFWILGKLELIWFLEGKTSIITNVAQPMYNLLKWMFCWYLIFASTSKNRIFQKFAMDRNIHWILEDVFNHYFNKVEVSHSRDKTSQNLSCLYRPNLFSYISHAFWYSSLIKLSDTQFFLTVLNSARRWRSIHGQT